MPATIATTQPKTLYSQNSSNMAIKADLDKLAQRGRVSDPCEINKALMQKYLDYKERDYQDWIEKLNTGQMIANLTEGKLVPMRHARTGQMRLVKPDGRWSDNKTVGGKFQFYITNLLAEWISSRPERDPICPSDQDQIEEFIANVKVVQDFYDRKFFTTPYEKKEFASAANFGTWITRFRFDKDADDLICELLPFPACRWDMRVMAEESPYFIYESKCLTATLEYHLDVDVPNDSNTEHYGLQIMEQITRQGTGVRGEGKDRLYGTYESVKDETVVTEMWLQPEAYCNIELAFPEKTVSGQIIPKGRSLLEVFPKGLCAVGINNMQTIIGLYAENHKDHIVSGIYHDRAFSGVGKGVDDAVDVYKELNDLHSQLLTHVKTHSTPGFGYNQDMVSEADARDIGKPRKNIPFDFTNAPDGVNSVNQAIQAIIPGNPAVAGFQYKAELEKDLQSAFQVTAFSEGLPGVNNETATGAKIGESLAMKQLLPQHMNKADQRSRCDKVIYNLFKKHINKPKWFASKVKNGITAGKFLTGDQFNDVVIEFEIVANSEAPKTPYANESSWSRLFQFSGGPVPLWELGQQDPDYANTIATAFGISKTTFAKPQDIARICRKRIEQAKEMLEQELMEQQILTNVTGMPIDNTGLAASVVSRLMPPISPKERYAEQKARWLAELLDADEMQYAPEELRYVIEEMISVQLQVATLGQAQIGLDTNMGMVMSRLPELVGEQVMNYQNQALEAEMAASQQQESQQANDQTAQMQMANDERQRQHETMSQDKELADNAEERKNRVELGKLQNSRQAKAK